MNLKLSPAAIPMKAEQLAARADPKLARTRVSGIGDPPMPAPAPAVT